jgi:hypothetical protein
MICSIFLETKLPDFFVFVLLTISPTDSAASSRAKSITPRLPIACVPGIFPSSPDPEARLIFFFEDFSLNSYFDIR